MLARFPRRTSLALVGAVALVMAIASPAAAPPGDLDPTFDGDGKVTTDFASQSDEANAVAIQGDGKVVAAGFAITGTFDFALARYNTDGSLDTSFDGDGRVTTHFATNEQAFAVAIQGDGKIVAAGCVVCGTNIGSDFALARYNTDGSLDPSFDGDGKVTTDIAGGFDRVEGVAVQADGKIVAAGLAQVSGTGIDFGLARYNTDGSLDTSFDGDGKVNTDFAPFEDHARAVAIQADGKIVAAGCADCILNTADFALARYNTDGSLDTTFAGGRVTTSFVGFDRAEGVAIQGDGKIVAAGHTEAPGIGDFALARYENDGSLDTTLDGDGRVTTDIGGIGDEAHAVAIQRDGKIVAAGFTGSDFALARYNPDGSLDTTFGGDGKVTTDFAGSADEARAVTTQADGKIVAAGRASVSGNQDFALARYTVSLCRRVARASMPICL